MAFRAIYNGEAPAVSIDPHPDDNTVMQVAYFGGIEETHFGQVLFESDRFLKVYGQGRDNVTGEEIASNVEGYRSELDFASCRQLSNAPVWHRLWFEPGISEGTKVRISTDRRAILFDGAHMIVKTEYIPDESSRVSPGSDPAAEQFVAHVSAHLAEFAAEQPVLHQLATLQRFLIIARWLRDEDIAIDQGWLAECPMPWHETPMTTPRIQVSRSLSSCIVSLEGGVDLTFENVYAYNDSQADAAAQAVRDTPTENGVWHGQFAHDGPGDWLATFPAQRRISYQYVDGGGNTWIYDAETDRPLSFINGQDGTVVNFDEYDQEGRLRQMTVGVADNVVRFTYSDDALVDIIYSRPELMDQHIEDLLDSALDVPPPEPRSAWRWFYDGLFATGRLARPSLHLLNRLAIILMRLFGYNGVYIYEVDGTVIIQRGFDQRRFEGLSLQELHTLLIQNQPLPETLSRFLFPDVQQNVVIITGLTSSEAEEAFRRELSRQLAREARRLGVSDVYCDDDPRRALVNLNRQYPLIDETGAWDLALIVDETSFPADQTVELERIESLIREAGIAVCTDWEDEECLRSNVIFLTARPDDQLKPSPEGSPDSPLAGACAAGRLQGRYVMLFVADQDGSRGYVRRFVTDCDAVGFLAYDGRVTLDSLGLVLEEFVRIAQADVPSRRAYETFAEAVDDALGRPGLTPEQQAGLHTLRDSFSYISALRPGGLYVFWPLFLPRVTG
jgi:hypothetical protein